MVNSILHAEPVVEHRCELGEGPLWDVDRQLIHWLDIEKGQIHSFNPVTARFTSINVHQRIGCIAFREGTTEFIAGLENGFATIHPETGTVSLITDPEAHLPGNRFNDGKCDPSGRFWAGTMSMTEQTGAGNLYTLGEHHTVSKKIAGVTISNGMAWSINHKTFYYIDTPTQAITAWDFDHIEGTISSKRTIIKIPETEGSPDGMTIDAEGMLWVAHWGGSQLSRWDPGTGKKLLSVPLPVSRVTSCTFGGSNLDDLYITTAKTGMDKHEEISQPHAGKLFIVRNCGYRGLPTFSFRG